MNYTPQQVMSAIGIGQQTLRYWRKSLPPLANRQGHSACFAFSDLVALKVVHVLVEELGMTISALTPFAEELFSVCRAPSSLQGSGPVLIVLQPLNGSLVRTLQHSWIPGKTVEVVIPLSECVQELMSTLHDTGEQDPQLNLALPLASIAGKA